MKKYIALLIVSCLISFLNGCAPKMIPPTDPRGLKCVELATKIKNACYDKWKEPIEACEERNSRRKRLTEINMKLTKEKLTKKNKLTEEDQELLEEKAKDNDLSEDQKLLAYTAIALRGALEMENCNSYAKECDDEYKELFVSKCGGRIE